MLLRIVIVGLNNANSMVGETVGERGEISSVDLFYF